VTYETIYKLQIHSPAVPLCHTSSGIEAQIQLENIPIGLPVDALFEEKNQTIGSEAGDAITEDIMVPLDVIGTNRYTWRLVSGTCGSFNVNFVPGVGESVRRSVKV
jgi:hypothetical protein